MEETAIVWLSYLMIVSGICTFIALVGGLRAMYGRYTVQSAFTVPPKLDWFIQELPSFAIVFYYYWQTKTIEGSIVLTMFLIHYFNRAFIYPLQMKSAKGTPWFISFSAILFCTWNGYIQGSWHAKYAVWHHFFINPLSYFGILIFFAGMYINIQSDSILRNLRKPGETGYKIPRGGLFEYVSGANFFGEIIEWCGYAMACRTLPAFAFFLFTVCNIGPRAYQHHLDYHTKFKDYPKERKALIPFIL